MIQETNDDLPPLSAADLAFADAIEADAAISLKRLGFDDKFGSKRLTDLIHTSYVTELMIIAQMIRWFEIRLVTPQELNAVHPTVLMIDLRRRIMASPLEYVPSEAMNYTIARMMLWWEKHTITSAWRSLKAHVRVTEASADLADSLASFIWNVRGLLGPNTEGDT